LLLGVFELELEFPEFVGECIGPLSMAIAAGGEVADTDLEGFALGFASGGLDLPGVSGAEKFGDEDARRGQELRDSGRAWGGHGASCRGERTRFGQ